MSELLEEELLMVSIVGPQKLMVSRGKGPPFAEVSEMLFCH